MTRIDYLLAVILGAAYVFLIPFFISFTITWGNPASWYDHWGRTNFVAVSWMQTYHSIGVILAAIPVALFVVWRYQSDWKRPTLIIAMIGSSYMLFDQIRAAWLVRQHEITVETYHLISGAIDVVKVGVFVLVVTAFFRLIVSAMKPPV